jgi:hypothetical protein
MPAARAAHLHSGTGLLLATVLVLAAGIGVVHAERPPSPVALVSPIVPVGAISAVDGLLATTTTLPATTTVPPTTTTTEAATPPAPVVRTAPPTTAAPRPTTTTTAAPAATEAPPADGSAYALQLLHEVVPARWLAVLPVRVTVISGRTSWSSFSGLIEIGNWHLYHAVDRAKNTLAHEWGHQVAWHYGTDQYEGAPPAGFPYSGRTPEEQWADCVAQALTGTVYPSSGLGACPADALAFVRSFLDAGPGPKLR